MSDYKNNNAAYKQTFDESTEVKKGLLSFLDRKEGALTLGLAVGILASAVVGPYATGDKSVMPSGMKKVQVETTLSAPAAQYVLDNFVVEHVVPNGDQGYMSEPVSDEMRKLFVLKTSPHGTKYLSPTTVDEASVEVSNAEGISHSSKTVNALVSPSSSVSVLDTETGETFNPSLPLGGKFILENEKTSKLIDPNEINFNQTFNETKDTVGVSGDKLLELLKTPGFSRALKDTYGYGDYRAIDVDTGDLADGSNLKDGASYVLKSMDSGDIIDPATYMSTYLKNINATGVSGDELLDLLRKPEFSNALKDAYGYGDYRAIDLETGDFADASNLKDGAKYALKNLETGVVIDPVSLMQSHDQSAGFEQSSLGSKNNTGNDGSPKTLVELDTPEKIEVSADIKRHEVNINKIRIPVSVNKIKIPVSLGDEDKQAIKLDTPERVSVKLDTPRVYVSLGDDGLSPDSSNFKAHIGDSQTIEEIKNREFNNGYKTSNP